MTVFHDILYLTGGTNGSGPVYLEWSGFIGNVTIFGGILVWYKHHKCLNCHRIAHHSVSGTPYKTCHKHATVVYHAKIQSDHKRNYPGQHRLLNKEYER